MKSYITGIAMLFVTVIGLGFFLFLETGCEDCESVCFGQTEDCLSLCDDDDDCLSLCDEEETACIADCG